MSPQLDRTNTFAMQSIMRTGPRTAISNPFLGTTFSYRVAAAPAPGSGATRMVTAMAKKKVGSAFGSCFAYTLRLKNQFVAGCAHHCDTRVH